MRRSGRLQAGLSAGGIGAILLVISSLTGLFWLLFSFFGGVMLALVAGYFAGARVGGNPAFAGRVVGGGALAGVVAGATLLVGQVISGIVAANQAGTLTQFQQAGGGGGIDAANITLAFAFIGGCFGVLDIALAASIGAAGGALAGRNQRTVPSQTVPELPLMEYPPSVGHGLDPNIVQPPPRQPDVPPQS